MNKNETVSLSVSDAIQHIGLDQLKPHPRNEEIYGCTESIADLVELIQLKGYVQPLTVKTDGTIVSGHRRWRGRGARRRERQRPAGVGGASRAGLEVCPSYCPPLPD